MVVRSTLNYDYCSRPLRTIVTRSLFETASLIADSTSTNGFCFLKILRDNSSTMVKVIELLIVERRMSNELMRIVLLNEHP